MTRTRFLGRCGSSMGGALDADLLEVVPCSAEALHAGDVVVFRREDLAVLVAHRVVSVDQAGLHTRGDLCDQDDPVVDPGCVLGRVAASWRDGRRRVVRGGLAGRLAGWLAAPVSRVERGLRTLLEPLAPLAEMPLRASPLPRLIPRFLRPQIVTTLRGEDLRLVFLGRTLGRYDPRSASWRVPRRYWLLCDPRSLPTP